MSALVALSLFVVSTVATVATVAELEPLEPSCLLQKAKEQQEQPGVEAPRGTEFFCGPDCRCRNPVDDPASFVDLDTCALVCGLFPAFEFTRNEECRCCTFKDVIPFVQSAETYVYSRIFPSTPAGYDFQCGPNCRCAGFSNIRNIGLDIGQCADLCASEEGFIFAPFNVQTECRCCSDLVRVQNDPFPVWFLYAPSGGGSTGDPHINTFDGHHYILLSQGTFSLWHFSGVETDFHSEETGGTKKFPVDWQAYAHYSGGQSFTKGLLLIDKSGGSMRQILEITSQDCKWKARKGNEEWTVVDSVHNESISVPDAGEYITGFDLSRTVTNPHGHRFPNRVRFNMHTKNGKSDIAVLSLSCRPSHNINVQISMKHKSDQQFVDGELKAGRKSLSTLQMSTDSEFTVDSKWQELGGSEQAAKYLQLADEDRASGALLQAHGCSDAEKELAKQTCSKHLGEEHGTEDAHFLEDCIYDLCHGAGETQAELVAELLATTRAD